MGPLHNIWVGMTAAGLYFRKCTDLTSVPCAQTRGLIEAPPMQTGRKWWAQLKVKPSFSLALPPPQTVQHALCTPGLPSVQCEKQHEAGWFLHPHCAGQISYSHLQDAFLNSSFWQNSHLNCLFSPQKSRLAQVDTKYPSKLSIWMAFRIYPHFQWGTNTWAVLCLKVLGFFFWLLPPVKPRFCWVFQLHFCQAA